MTVAYALFGGAPAGLSNEGGAVVAGPDAGRKEDRYIGAVIAGVFMLGIALAADLFSGFIRLFPAELIATLIGLALLRVVADGFRRMLGGPLRVAPVVAFTVALTPFTIGGIGAVVWSLVAGLTVAALAEPTELKTAWREASPA